MEIGINRRPWQFVTSDILLMRCRTEGSDREGKGFGWKEKWG